MLLLVGALVFYAVEPWLPALARLRIAVFREWPYLYAGSEAYEREYLGVYLRSPDSLFVLAKDGGTVVGASSGMPLDEESEAFRVPFERAGIDPGTVFYFAESVLLPGWRGQGVGHRFFDMREAHVRRLGRRHVTFCAVLRPEGHPLRPAGYRPLDAFWQKRGYEKLPGVVAHFGWKDLGEPAETEKELQFWMRPL